jgi:hypothetical protein
VSDTDDLDELEQRRRDRAAHPDSERWEASKKKARQERKLERQNPPNDAAGFGQSWGSQFRPGQSLLCTIVALEPGGYAVQVKNCEQQGFLPTQAILNVGAEVLAQYVCEHNGRLVLSARFASP